MKKGEKRLLLILIVVVVLCYLVGYGVGRLLGHFDTDAWLSSISSEKTGAFFGILYSIVWLIGEPLMIIDYWKAKKAVDKWDGENEDELDNIEPLLNPPMIIGSILMILNICFFSCTMYFVEDLTDITTIMNFVQFFLGIALCVMIPKLTVDLEKQLNPEKEGSVLDFRFEQQWMNSSDEAQKLIAYKSGYAGYKAGNFACMIMWLISFVSGFAFHTGIMPTICVCAVWLVMVVANVHENIKLEK
mgnify:CR=1 FL=1